MLDEKQIEQIDALAFGLLEPAEEAALLARLEAMKAAALATLADKPPVAPTSRVASVPAAVAEIEQALSAARRRRELLAAWTVPSATSAETAETADRVLSLLAARGEAVSPIKIAKPETLRPTRPISPASRPRRRWLSLLTAAAAAAGLCATLTPYFQLAHLPADPMRTVVEYPAYLPADSHTAVRVSLRDGSADEADDAAGGDPIAGGTVLVRLCRADAGSGSSADEAPVFETHAATGRDGSAAIRISTAGLEPGPYRMTVDGRSGDRLNRVERTVLLIRPFTVLVQADKPVYRVGDKLKMRAVVLRKPSGRPAAGQAVEFRLLSANGAAQMTASAAADKFGIAAAEFELKAELGFARLAAVVLDGTRAAAVSETPVYIGAYALPTASVEITPDKPWYAPTDLIDGTVRATDRAGKPLAGAEVTLTLSAPADGAAPEVVSLKTRADGTAKFHLDQPRDAGKTASAGKGGSFVGEPARLLLKAEVRGRGADGREAAAAKAAVLPVSASPLLVRLVPEGRRPVPGIENRLYAAVTTPDGRPAPGASVRVGKAGTPVAVDAAGMARLSFVPASGRDVRVEVFASLAGVEARAVWAPEAAAADSGGTLLLRPARTVCRAGETLDVAVLASAGASGTVLVDVFAGETFLLSGHAVDVRQGAGKLELDLPTDVVGTLVLRARWADPAGGREEGDRRLIIVEPAASARIAAEWDRKSCAPGETAKLAVAVTDAAGSRPVPAALGVSIADLSLRKVLENRPDALRQYLLMEERLRRNPVWRTADRRERPRLPAALRRSAAAEDAEPRSLLRAAILAEAEARLPEPTTDGDGSVRRGDSRDAQDYRRQLRRHAGMRPLLAGAFLSALMLFIGLGTAIPAGRRLPAAMLLVAACGTGVFFLAMASWIPERPTKPEYPALPPPEPAAIAAFGAPKSVAPEWEAAKLSAVEDTLLWLPSLHTDAGGKAVIPVTLKPAPTRWRASLSAVTEDGRIGTLDLDLPADGR